MKPFNIPVVFFCLALVAATCSCKKYVDVDSPRLQLSGTTVFDNNATATAAMLSIYTQMESDGIAYQMLLAGGTSSDELNTHLTSVDAIAIATNSLTPENGTVALLWNDFYQYIYQANAILNGLELSDGVSGEVKDQLRGEALFVRAWSHFYLASLFENISYVSSTDPFLNASLPQQRSVQIYQLALADLQLSKNLLAKYYVTAINASGGERIRPNYYVAVALMARISLYLGKWQDAESYANEVISNTSAYSLSMNLASVFLKNSSEAIWQLQSVLPKFNTVAGANLNSTASIPNIASLTNNLVDSFENTDLRKTSWTRQTTATVVYNWMYKYKVGQNAPSVTEYTLIMRLAEIYLIRAEARAMQDKLIEGYGDLNVIRQRAGIQSLPVVSKAELLRRIGRERRVELFGEFADRWLDLRRTGTIDQVLQPRKGQNWAATDAIFPIPLTEIIRHPGMIQNPGY